MPMLFSQTIGAAIAARYWFRVRCLGSGRSLDPYHAQSVIKVYMDV
jgi:hypothetical protein